MKIKTRSRFFANWNRILWGSGFLVLVVILSLRWTDENQGYPSEAHDFASHFSIIENIKRGHLFLEWNQPATSEHSISRFLPIYHGLIASHMLAAGLSPLAGSTTRAMLILTDLAFLIGLAALVTLTVFRFQLSIWGVALVLFGYIFNFLLMTSFGIFSQPIGISLGILAYSWPENFKKMRILTLLLSAGCYPDVLMLISPWVVLKSSGAWKRWIFAAVYLVVAAILIRRFSLPGGIVLGFEIYPLFVVLLAIFGVGIRSGAWRFDFETALVFTFTVTALVLTLISELWLGKVTYYSQKILYWTPALLPIALSKIHRRFQALIFLPLFFMGFIWNRNETGYLLSQYSQGSSSLTHQAETTARTLIQHGECHQGLLVATPLRHDPGFPLKISTRNIALAALTERYLVQDGKYNLEDFGKSRVDVRDYDKVAGLLVNGKRPVGESQDDRWFYLCP